MTKWDLPKEREIGSTYENQSSYLLKEISLNWVYFIGHAITAGIKGKWSKTEN